MKRPKTLAFLLNLWARDPYRVQKIFDRHPDRREDVIRRLIFSGDSLTGRRLRDAFGSDLCGRIVWEETSLTVASLADEIVTPDIYHIFETVRKHRPDIVVSFGSVVQGFVWRALAGVETRHMVCCHPAARQSNAMEMLRLLGEELRRRGA